jgi:hypothetical protein
VFGNGGPPRLILPVEESVKSFQHDGFVLVFQSLFHNYVPSWQVLVWVIEIQYNLATTLEVSCD